MNHIFHVKQFKSTLYDNLNCKKCIIVLIIALSCTLCGCGVRQTAEENIIQEYKVNNRLNKYYELKKKYDDNMLILFINTKEDHTLLNSAIWLLSHFLPDLPTICATGGILGIIAFTVWWLGITFTGGAILAVLAYWGTMMGGLPGVPPAIAGIIFLCIMFSILSSGCSAIIG